MELELCMWGSAPFSSAAAPATGPLLGRVPPDAVHRILIQGRIEAVKIVLVAPAVIDIEISPPWIKHACGCTPPNLTAMNRTDN